MGKKRKFSSVSSFPHDETYVTIRYETADGVEEILVETVDSGYIYVPDLLRAFCLSCSQKVVRLTYTLKDGKTASVRESKTSSRLLSLPRSINEFELSISTCESRATQHGQAQPPVSKELFTYYQKFVLHFNSFRCEEKGDWIRTDSKRCAAIVDSTWAITAAHCLRDVKGDPNGGERSPRYKPFTLHRGSGAKYEVTVELIDNRDGFDYAWLKIRRGTQFPHYPKSIRIPSVGDKLILVGESLQGFPLVVDKQADDLCMLRATVHSNALYAGRVFVGSPGTYPGHSGAPVFYDEHDSGCDDARLMGITLGGPYPRYEKPGSCLQDEEYHDEFAKRVTQPSKCHVLSLSSAIQIRDALIYELNL